jgi:hypothetical protein
MWCLSINIVLLRMKVTLFWVVALCSLVEVYQNSEVHAASIRLISKPCARNRLEIQKADGQGMNLTWTGKE